MPDYSLPLAVNLTTSSVTRKPVLGRFASQELRGGMPAILRIQRGGVATPAGSLTVHGANLPNPWANRANTALFRQRADVTDANLVAADYQFLSGLTHVAFSNYNWITLLDEFAQVVVEQGAALGHVISNSGGFARLDFNAATGTGDGATTVFDLNMDFEYLTHCNLQVKVNAVTQAASAFALSNNAGKIRVTFTAAPGNTLALNYQLYPKPSKSFGLVFTTPATLKSAGVVPQSIDEIATRDAMWVVTGAGVTGSIDCHVLPPS